MRMKPFAASTLSELPEAARALREFALESSHPSHPNGGGDPEESVLMPSHEFIVAAGRHDLGWGVSPPRPEKARRRRRAHAPYRAVHLRRVRGIRANTSSRGS